MFQRTSRSLRSIVRGTNVLNLISVGCLILLLYQVGSKLKTPAAPMNNVTAEPLKTQRPTPRPSPKVLNTAAPPAPTVIPSRTLHDVVAIFLTYALPSWLTVPDPGVAQRRRWIRMQRRRQDEAVEDETYRRIALLEGKVNETIAPVNVSNLSLAPFTTDEPIATRPLVAQKSLLRLSDKTFTEADCAALSFSVEQHLIDSRALCLSTRGDIYAGGDAAHFSYAVDEQYHKFSKGCIGRVNVSPYAPPHKNSSLQCVLRPKTTQSTLFLSLTPAATSTTAELIATGFDIVYAMLARGMSSAVVDANTIVIVKRTSGEVAASASRIGESVDTVVRQLLAPMFHGRVIVAPDNTYLQETTTEGTQSMFESEVNVAMCFPNATILTSSVPSTSFSVDRLSVKASAHFRELFLERYNISREVPLETFTQRSNNNMSDAVETIVRRNLLILQNDGKQQIVGVHNILRSAPKWIQKKYKMTILPHPASTAGITRLVHLLHTADIVLFPHQGDVRRLALLVRPNTVLIELGMPYAHRPLKLGRDSQKNFIEDENENDGTTWAAINDASVSDAAQYAHRVGASHIFFQLGYRDLSIHLRSHPDYFSGECRPLLNDMKLRPPVMMGLLRAAECVINASTNQTTITAPLSPCVEELKSVIDMRPEPPLVDRKMLCQRRKIKIQDTEYRSFQKKTYVKGKARPYSGENI